MLKNISVTRPTKLIGSYHMNKSSIPLSSTSSVTSPLTQSLQIGVLTLPLNSNIGGNLQAYAMMEVLKKLGHSPVFINRRHPLLNVAPTDATNASHSLWAKSVGLGANFPNSAFIDKYLAPITIPFHSTEALARDVDRFGFDVIIAGSDQIWRPRYSRSILPDYFFNFLPADSPIRRVSYAASFGAPHWEFNEAQARVARQLIKNFDAISVREDSAVELCAKHLDVQAKHVLDPTLLLDRSAYAPIIAEAKHRSHDGQIIAYILDSDLDKTAVIRSLSNSLGLNAFATTGRPLFQENKPANTPNDRSVQQWLSSIAGANFVVTDSFHGVVFSILFNKPFIAYGNPARGMARFTSLLKMVGLEKRLVVNSSEVDLKSILEPIDWGVVNARLEMWRKESFDFLISALSEKHQKKDRSNATISIATAKAIERNGVSGNGDRPKTKTEDAYFLRKPDFSSNNEKWRITSDEKRTHLEVTNANFPLRGNLVWCDLPTALSKDTVYSVTIEWILRTSAKFVNVHLRNPETGKSIIIGSAQNEKQVNQTRRDTFKFFVWDDNFSQLMLGAMHFTGANAGADIISISIETLKTDSITEEKRTHPIIDLRVQELSQIDSNRYINSYAQNRISRSIGHARALMMYHGHAFEKGLSRTIGFRPGFGQWYIGQLASQMNQWVSAGHSTKDSFFKIAASVMRSYFERHDKLGVDISSFWNLFDTSVQAVIKTADTDSGGALAANADREAVVEGLHSREFLDVVFSRRSIREFTLTPVSREDIEKAVEIAIQAPSVCNRQSARVRAFDNQDIIREVLALQGGLRGYKLPPKLLLISSDLSAFVDATERNQAFIDGGLFMMLLLLGLEQVGLGACSLNTAMNSVREAAIRKILNIPESEVFIAFIAVGHFDAEVMIPRSKRIPVNEVFLQNT